MKHYLWNQTEEMKHIIIERNEMELLSLHLKKGQIVPEHSIEGVGTAIVLEGEVKFHSEIGNDQIAHPYDVIQFEPCEIHSLEAMEESILYVYRQAK